MNAGTAPSHYTFIFAMPNQPLILKMNSDVRAVKASLLKRELELQRLIRQMKFDQLHNSPVYKNLEQELQTVKHQLAVAEPNANPGFNL